MRQLKSLVVVLAACLCAGMSQATAAQGILQSFFTPGEEIVKGQPYYSPDKRYFAVHQPQDNNLVIHETDGGKFIWGLNEEIGDSYRSVTRILLGADGVFSGLDENYNQIWAPPGVVIIDRITLPEVAQTGSPIPAGNYRTLVMPYGWQEPQLSGGRIRGIVWEANNLKVQADGTFEIANFFETRSSGTLTQSGEQICASSDLGYALSGEGNEGNGGCYSFSNNIQDALNANPNGSLRSCQYTLSSEDRNQLIILCP